MFDVFVALVKSSLTNSSNLLVANVLFILVSAFKTLFLYFSFCRVLFNDEIISFSSLTLISSVESVKEKRIKLNTEILSDDSFHFFTFQLEFIERELWCEKFLFGRVLCLLVSFRAVLGNLFGCIVLFGVILQEYIF